MKLIIRNMAGSLMILLSACSFADEEQKPKTNPDAIPSVITPDDPELQLTIEEQRRLARAKSVDGITSKLNVLKVNGKPPPSSHDRVLEQIQKKKFDANPRQTIPLKDCIKPDGVIDNEVNDCMNGRVKKTW